MPLHDRELASIPFAVIDVETTGLSSRHDRVLEFAIIVVRPGEEPQVAFDSLIRPDRPVASTEIHGITDADVADAPPFAAVAGVVVAALANRVVCSHNVYFDVAFLHAELDRCGYAFDAPHLCTMLLPRVVDPTIPHLSLARACERWGVDHGGHHAAVHDAMAAAKLLREHIRRLRASRVRTFGDLKRGARGEYKFLESFGRPLMPAPPAVHRAKTLKPRGSRLATGRRGNIAEYLEALLDAAADLHFTEDELRDLQVLPARLDLRDAEVRAVHAKVFWAMLARYVEDARIDLGEASHLSAMRQLLAKLGWAPGDDVLPSTDDLTEAIGRGISAA